MLQSVVIALLALSPGGPMFEEPISTFDPQNWEVTHTTIVRPTSSKRDSSLTVTHPMPLRRPWSAVPSEQSDGLWGWDVGTASPPEAFLDQFRLEQRDGLVEVEPIEKGYGYRWHVNGVMSAEARFTSHFYISTTGRRLNDRFRVDSSASIPLVLQQSVLKIIRESPPSVIKSGKELAKDCRDEVEAVRLFSKWIKAHIAQRAPVARPFDLAVIWQGQAANRRGMGVLFRAFCASMGIPAREARGYVITAGQVKNARMNGGRTWSEVWIRGAGWMEVEPSTDSDAFFIPASYVQNGYWPYTWVDRKNISLPKPSEDLTDEIDDRITWHRIR